MCEESFHYLPNFGCITISETTATVDDGDSVCPASTSMFAPSSLYEYELLRTDLVDLKGDISNFQNIQIIYDNIT